MPDLKEFDSVGGFSVDQTSIVDEKRNLTDVRSARVKDSDLPGANKTEYIVEGLNTDFLTLGQSFSPNRIQLPNSSISFITLNLVGISQSGNGNHLVIKLESSVECASNGAVTHISSFETIIKDTIPSFESWTVTPFDGGNANAWSYSTTVAGASNVKWYGLVTVVSANL